ncbi:thioredoxin family protein [Anditalea andensis]|uniref:Thioredoxin n=1 Tax=Anditalea andensis TaxID=1048983 RepID=A0A074KY49_9BACT|nr:thioredoxin family protein [Anditalea andensis]KEO73100.1 thioredoxin [Anditalea andensis]
MVKTKIKELIRQSEELILVDFYADWCSPCQTMEKVIQETVSELGNKITVIKVNVDQNKQAALSFSVRSIPHYILFRKGKILWRKGGIIPKRELIGHLKGFI